MLLRSDAWRRPAGVLRAPRFRNQGTRLSRRGARSLCRTGPPCRHHAADFDATVTTPGLESAVHGYSARLSPTKQEYPDDDNGHCQQLHQRKLFAEEEAGKHWNGDIGNRH